MMQLLARAADRHAPPLLMGVLNVTPDSFSDGGEFSNHFQALAQARVLLAEGADIIDIGGESTRPGATPISVDEECARVIPLIEALRADSAVCISIDTVKPAVMRAAIAAGANMINDVCALRQPDALATAAALGVPVCLMHMLGEPGTMQDAPHYDNVVDEVLAFLSARVTACCDAGIPGSMLWIDPGFGFGKTLAHNLQLLAGLRRLCASGPPVLAGLSRKSMIGALTGRTVSQRISGSVAAAVIAYQRGARILRVHDIAQTRDALKVAHAIAELDEE
jgi:dihydropteroate synthase